VAATITDLNTRYGDELMRFCRWMLKDPEDAADALQDTWIRAMSALGESSIRIAALRPWLYAIARNTCLDRLRERRRVSLHDLDEESAGETPGADEVVALRHEAGAALALVGALSERQRSALLMREIAGMSVPEIATALGLTPDRAAWAIGDARRALEDARAGGTMECEDARARLSSGHRGRTLRSHLSGCTGCCAHDRRLRAGRVLAPALVPFLWLRKLSLPFFAHPAATATMAVALAATGAHRGPQVAAPQPARGPAVSHVGALAAPAPSRKAAPVQVSDRRNAPALARTGRSVPSARRRGAAVLAGQPAQPLPAVPRAPGPALASAPEPIRLPRLVTAATTTVQRTVDTVAEAARGVPVAGPLADEVAGTAGAVLDGLG